MNGTYTATYSAQLTEHDAKFFQEFAALPRYELTQAMADGSKVAMTVHGVTLKEDAEGRSLIIAGLHTMHRIGPDGKHEDCTESIRETAPLLFEPDAVLFTIQLKTT